MTCSDVARDRQRVRNVLIVRARQAGTTALPRDWPAASVGDEAADIELIEEPQDELADDIIQLEDVTGDFFSDRRSAVGRGPFVRLLEGGVRR